MLKNEPSVGNLLEYVFESQSQSHDLDSSGTGLVLETGADVSRRNVTQLPKET